MHSNRMRTACSLTVSLEWGVCPPHLDVMQTPPGCRLSRMQTPLDASERMQMPLGADLCWMQTPRMQTPLWMQTPPVNRIIHKGENITLPQTSFAGGNIIKVQTINNNYFQMFSFFHVNFLKSGFAFTYILKITKTVLN